MKRVAIIGAGPAGLSAAYKLITSSENVEISIFEKDSEVGGLSKSFCFNSEHLDVGGHRYFSKDNEVLNLWKEISESSNVTLGRINRLSHIIYNDNKLIKYPVELSFDTLCKVGFSESIKIILSYFFSRNREPKSLENFYINNFGNELYSLFFKEYTEKLWGIAPNLLSPDWGSQRTQNLTISYILKNMLLGQKNIKRTMNDSFIYPENGCGFLWESLSNFLRTKGVSIFCSSDVVKLELKNNNIESIWVRNNQKITYEKFDYYISSMPLNEIISCMDCSIQIKEYGRSLKYRDMIVVGIEFDRKDAGKLHSDINKDTWVYVQSSDYVFGRIQLIDNWKLRDSYKEQISIELELFCSENDKLWSQSDDELVKTCIEDLSKLKIISNRNTCVNSIVKRIRKAYPIYDGGYKNVKNIEAFMMTVNNLYCVGRNGQHRYNNMDHATKTGIIAADCILYGDKRRNELWKVNSDDEYIE